MPFTRAATLLVLAAVATHAFAQPRASSPEFHEAECRKVVLDFMTAIDAGDAATLREVVYVAEPQRNVSAQRDGLEAFIACVVAQREYEAALAERFGPAAAAPVAAQSRFAKADYDAVQNARFEPRGDEAALILAPNVSPITLQRRNNYPTWRVVLRSVSTLYSSPNPRRQPPGAAEPGSQRRIDDMNAAARTVRDAAAQVRAGAFPTPAAAAAALQNAIEKAAAAAG
jgi:hypothetical protein